MSETKFHTHTEPTPTSILNISPINLVCIFTIVDVSLCLPPKVAAGKMDTFAGISVVKNRILNACKKLQGPINIPTLSRELSRVSVEIQAIAPKNSSVPSSVVMW
jgi:hypothetical protein